ncbi:LysM peptidoglycan-binding domain-containing protein [Novosphingobium sp. KN65.2]|uniref:LysM peptidoglycan-binding domain-containing protein n=1 Tax=Novosphingobium sp. KN65.2 TaxID=1478134 RepID=UPI0005E9B7E8|nr:LysM peptidoglycan-binding domain-containing protein [Novosphingobium sp. KN65.2]CDO37038.1 Membrane protein (modular protein) [Novosphingobium sp. KN65.2]
MKAPLLLAAAAVLPGLVIAPTQAQAANAAQEAVHVVEPGETLNGIANRAGVDAGDLAKANNLQAPFVVRVGQELAIPRGSATDSSPAAASGTYEVTFGETLYGIANRTGAPASAIASANGLEPPYVLRIGQKLTIPGKTQDTGTVRTASREIAARTESTSIISPEQETVHSVTPGETLGGIAARAKVARILIAEANGLQPPYIVKAGQKLQIPRTRRHTVKAGDTGFAISYKYAVPWDQIATANGLDPEAPVKPGQSLLIPTLLNLQKSATAQPAVSAAVPAPITPAASKSRFLWPVYGPVRRDFSSGANYHDGLDITAAKGTMVRAAAAGTVKFAGKEKEQFGNLVVIDHGDGWFTAYGFLSRITVKDGARVAAGERIGLVGDTGRAKGDELHFEVRRDGKPVDPLDELPKSP